MSFTPNHSNIHGRLNAYFKIAGPKRERDALLLNVTSPLLVGTFRLNEGANLHGRYSFSALTKENFYI